VSQPVEPATGKRRNWWVWISALLALVAAGLLVWALSVKSDQESAQDELANTKQQLDESEQQQAQATPTPTPAPADEGPGGALAAAGGLAAAKAVYDDLTAELGATQEDLASTEQDLKDADAKAKQAEQDAAAAEKQAASAGNETDKAKAEADKAKADATAAESRAAIVGDCAKAYLSAFGTLLEGDDVSAQAAKVREQLKGITADCQAALGAA
jgi:septal ring factor EnvC (AmiA/AmiB activator)